MIKRTLVLAVAVAALAIISVASAGSVHLKGGANATVSFRDNGLFLTASSAVSGLGDENVLLSVTAQANVTSTCTNKGGNAAPGQNPAPLTFTGADPIPADEIKNGTVTFSVETDAPETPIPGAPGCTNSNWTESIDDLAFLNATVTIEQPEGTVVLTVECEFSSPTEDGAVPRGDVTCTEV